VFGGCLRPCARGSGFKGMGQGPPLSSNSRGRAAAAHSSSPSGSGAARKVWNNLCVPLVLFTQVLGGVGSGTKWIRVHSTKFAHSCALDRKLRCEVAESTLLSTPKSAGLVLQLQSHD
jgi:hypothetical protein